MYRASPHNAHARPNRRSPVDSLRLRRRWRQLAALVLILAAVIVHVAGPSGSHTVLVARSDLEAGHVIAAEDLDERRAPTELFPEAALGRQAAEGAALAAPLARGEILTAGRVSGGAADSPHGESRVVAVPVADPGTLSLLREGSSVDVYAAEEARTIAPDPPREAAALPEPHEPLISGAIVTKVPQGARGDLSGTVALSVSAAQAPTLARAALESPLALVLVE